MLKLPCLVNILHVIIWSSFKNVLKIINGKAQSHTRADRYV